MSGTMEREYRYDAFISYRHLPLDMEVAVKLQNLLETYRVPKNLENIRQKKINRVFRDQSELPTSGDLGGDIREALLNSRYLIVVCSEETKNSLWCMEEIRIFKQAHQGHTDRILTLLISGDPAEVFPDELRWEIKRGVEDGMDGTVAAQEDQYNEEIKVQVEPLGADVRGKNRSETLKKLRVEFLRIASPLLGCSFDELYQRHQRRKRRRVATLAGTVGGALAVVLLIVSVFAYRTWVSEKNYRGMLAEEYIGTASAYTLDGNIQHALLYYTQALSIEPTSSTAATGAALLLQDYLWPVKVGEVEGILQEAQILPSSAQAGDAATGMYLVYREEHYQVVDKDLNLVRDVDSSYGSFHSDHGKGLWTFLSENTITFYHAVTGKAYQMEIPTEYSLGCTPEEFDLSFYDPSAVMIAEDCGVVAYGGLIHTVELLEDGSVREIARADMADAVSEEEKGAYIPLHTRCWCSEDGSVLVVNAGFYSAVYDTKNLMLRAVVEERFYGLMDAEVSKDGEYFLLAYGNMYDIDLRNPGSYFSVYDMGGNQMFISPERPREVIRGAHFHPKDSSQVVVWDRENVRCWNWKTGEQFIAPVCAPGVSAVEFREDDHLLVDLGDGTVMEYALMQLPQKEADDGSDIHQGDSEQKPSEVEGDLTTPIILENGLTLNLQWGALTMVDETGEIVETVQRTPVSRMLWSPERSSVYLYDTHTPILAVVKVDMEKRSFGELVQMDHRGVSVASIWAEENLTVIENSEGGLLVYDQSDTLIRVIMPQHTGNTEIVCTDGETYIAVGINEVRSGPGQGYTERCSVELYDLVSGVLIASFEENQPIDDLRFDEHGMLSWICGDDVGTRQIQLPEADAETLDFLRKMCCCVLENGNNISYQEPVSLGTSMGNWSSMLGEWTMMETEADPCDDEEKPEGTSESVLSFVDRANALILSDDFGEEAWFDRCNQLWQEMLDGEQQFTVLEMDSFYSNCLTAAAGKMEGHLQFGFEAYITLLKQYVANIGEDETIYTDYSRNFLCTLDRTKQWDEAIINTYRVLAAEALQHIDFTGIDQMDDLEALNTLLRYQACLYGFVMADFLESGGSTYLDQLLSLGQYGGMELSCAEIIIVQSMMEGDVAGAVACANESIESMEQIGADEALMEEMVNTWLSSASAFAWRGMIEDSALDEFLSTLDVACGIEVSAVSTQAQEAGLRVGDLITGCEGKRIASVAHYSRLREESQGERISVLRNGTTIEVSLPKSNVIYGSMSVQKVSSTE